MKISRTSIVGFSKGKTYKNRKSFRMYSVQKESFVKDGLWKILRTFVRKFSNFDFFLRLLPLKVDELVMSEMSKKKMGGHQLRLEEREQARKNTLNLKKQASLANKGTMSVSPKIMQLDLIHDVA